MSKKFFSLIHGGDIHVSPGVKVIEGKSFSTLVDAKGILKEVKSDAEKYKIEVASECEKLKEQAQKEGFEAGYSDWVEKLAELETEIKKVRSDMERVVIPIALKAAKKIVGRELEVSKDTVIDIITNSLKSVSQHKKIKIYVSKQDFELVEKNRNKIKSAFENLEALSVLPQDDVDQGGCIIETEGGIINAQLENQWLILENVFQKLMKSKKPSELIAEEPAQPQESPPQEQGETTEEE